ncbi:restriction endonuclease subunit S [Acinetobacter brisouii]
MQFKQYPSYKNSGVEWLGDVPEHWQIVRTKDIFNHRKEEALEDDEIVTAFRDGQVTLRKNRRTDGFTNSIKEHGYQHINNGDLVIHEMDAFAGAIGVSDSSGKSTPVYTVCYAKNENINHHFYSHFFRTMAKTGFINSLAKGIRVRSTEFRWNESRNVYLAEPPKADQEKIVSFLDTETARIDTLIAKQEKLIELLEEQRKSIISHAVTKGLNPNAPMKDSGVEWLGEVPEHFDSIKIKQLAISKLTYGANESAEQEIKEHPRYIRITDIKNDGTLNPESFKSLPPEIAEQYLLANNDILFARSGATVGKTFKYSDSWGVCCFAGYLIKLSVNVKIANPDYVFYYLNSYPYWEYIASNQSQSTIQNVSAEKYANFTIAIPKIFEQEKIVSFLDSETSRIDSLIAKQEKLIEKLKEYRASIISHAVTGKIDVREFGA